MRLKVLVFILSVLIVSCAWAETFDTPEEVIKVNKASIDTISIMPSQNWAVIQIFKGYEVEGNFIRTKVIRLEFRDVEDNPATEENEEDTSFTDLMATFTIDKAAMVQIIKSKLEE